ncbi:DUF3667 domain-containing protein [Algoriphagus namhaensis]
MAQSENIPSCVNCGASLKGQFCHICGEKKITSKDKGIYSFLEEFIASVFVADGKFFRTIKLSVTRPGELTRSYVKGIRKKYLSPLQVFFFANLIYFIFPIISTFNTTLEVQLYNLPYSATIRPVVEQYLENNQQVDADLFRVDYERTSSANGKLLLIILVVLQGLFLKLLYLKNKKLFLIDFLAGSAYFYGFYILFILVIFPASFNVVAGLVSISPASLINELILSISFLAVIVGYMYGLLQRGFGSTRAGAIWRSILLGVFIIPSFIIYRFILFWVTFWMVT